MSLIEPKNPVVSRSAATALLSQYWTMVPAKSVPVLKNYYAYVDVNKKGFLLLFPLLQNINVFLYFTSCVLQLEKSFDLSDYFVIFGKLSKPATPNPQTDPTAIIKSLSVNGSQPDMASFATNGADWSDFEESWPGTLESAIAVWCRRIALLVHFDRHYGAAGSKSISYSINSSFNDRDLLVSWDFRPTTVDTAMGQNDLYTGDGHAQGISYVVTPTGVSTWLPSKYIYDPDPRVAYGVGLEILATYKPKTPAEVCGALLDWIRIKKGWTHGPKLQTKSWYAFPPPNIDSVSKLDKAGPPVGYAGCSADSPYSCTFHQAASNRFGGCHINSSFIASVLRALGLPSVTAFGCICLNTKQQPTNPTWGGEGYYRNLGVFTGIPDESHFFVVCYGADLALDHGDDAINGFDGEQFASGISRWYPALPLFYLKQALRIEATIGVSSANPTVFPTVDQLKDWKAAVIKASDVLAKLPGYPAFTPSWGPVFANAKEINGEALRNLGRVFATMEWQPGLGQPPALLGLQNAITKGMNVAASPLVYSNADTMRQFRTRLAAIAVMPSKANPSDLKWGEDPIPSWDLFTKDGKSVKSQIGSSYAMMGLSCVQALAYPAQSTRSADNVEFLLSRMMTGFFALDRSPNSFGPGSQVVNVFPNDLAYDGAKNVADKKVCGVGFPTKDDYRNFTYFPSQSVAAKYSNGSLVDVYALDLTDSQKTIISFFTWAVGWYCWLRDPNYVPGK